jgi:hypothetical protein
MDERKGIFEACRHQIGMSFQPKVAKLFWGVGAVLDC